MSRKQSTELSYLTTFLNLRLSQSAELINREASECSLKTGASLGALKFIKAHQLQGPQSDLINTQRRISDFLMWLQPEVFRRIPPPEENTKPDSTEQMIKRFSADASHALGLLVKDLNRAERTSEWMLHKSPPAKSPNINVSGSCWLLKKYPCDAIGKVFHWVAKILEQDELSKMGCCRVCRRFFIRNRDWQKDCRDKCKKKYDNKISGLRKKGFTVTPDGLLRWSRKERETAKK